MLKGGLKGGGLKGGLKDGLKGDLEGGLKGGDVKGGEVAFPFKGALELVYTTPASSGCGLHSFATQDSACLEPCGVRMNK